MTKVVEGVFDLVRVPCRCVAFHSAGASEHIDARVLALEVLVRNTMRVKKFEGLGIISQR